MTWAPSSMPRFAVCPVRTASGARYRSATTDRSSDDMYAFDSRSTLCPSRYDGRSSTRTMYSISASTASSRTSVLFGSPVDSLMSTSVSGSGPVDSSSISARPRASAFAW
jgi:hypothetical protein